MDLTNSNIIIDVCYFAVPIFYMLTGVTLMDYRERYNTATYFKKRFIHIFIPYAAWSILAYLMKMYINHSGVVFSGYFSIHSLSSEIPSVISNILNSTTMPVYWFFIPLFAIYIGLPFVSILQEDKRYIAFTYAIKLFVIMRSIEMVIVVCGADYNRDLNYLPWEEYMIYPITGSLLDIINLKKTQKNRIYLFGIVGFFLLSGCTYIISVLSGKPFLLFRGYRNLPAFMYAVSIFLIIKSVKWDCVPPKVWSFFDSISPLTFGVYLVHQFLLIFISQNIGYQDNVFMVIGISIIVFIACMVVTYILSCIPLMRFMIGNPINKRISVNIGRSGEGKR